MKKSVIAMLVIATLGCSSVKSTFIDREPTTDQQIMAKLDGYPITLKVPTHLRITLYSNTVLYQPGMERNKDGKMELNKAKKGWQVATVNGTPVQTISYGILPVQTEKIFTVDHLRPAAGQIKFSTDFTEDQYIAALSSAATEDTIRQSSIAVSRAVRLMANADLDPRTSAEQTRTLAGQKVSFTEMKGVSKKKRPDPVETFVGTTTLGSDTNTKTLSSVLRTALFEIDDPEMELKVSAFLDEALQCARQ